MSEQNSQYHEKAGKLVDRFFGDEAFDVYELSNDDFKGLMYGLSRVFFARVLNCVDPSGKKDMEWSHLAAVMRRTLKMLEEKESMK